MKIPPSRFLIYGLLNPANSELFYVGQTKKRKELRLLEHIESAVSGRDTPVYAYIRRFLFSGTIPQIFVIEKMINKEGQDNAYEREKYWIQWFKDSSNFVLPLKWKPQTAKSYSVVIEKVSLTNLQNIIK